LGDKRKQGACGFKAVANPSLQGPYACASQASDGREWVVSVCVARREGEGCEWVAERAKAQGVGLRGGKVAGVCALKAVVSLAGCPWTCAHLG
jgi:hypothetical protein